MNDSRARILARRARFFGAALASAGISATAAGCSPCLSIEPPPQPPVVTDGGDGADAAPPAVAVKARSATAATTALDGIVVGSTTLREATSRAPYADACDDDPVDERSSRVLVYGAKPCRERAFPEATTVLLFSRYVTGPEKYDVPIDAVVWLGGDYFSSRSAFSLRPGHTVEHVDEVLGPPDKEFTLASTRRPLRVRRHAGDFWSILDGERVVGFAAGKMPDDPAREHWRGVAQMYWRYTAAER